TEDEYRGPRLLYPFVLGERRCFFMATGTVKWFNDAKGYGFITPDEGGKDLFVHHTNIMGTGFKSLSENSKVEYEAREGQKGPEPINVQTVGPILSARPVRRAAPPNREEAQIATEEKIELDGEVKEALGSGMFRVELDNGHELIAYTAGKMRRYRIRMAP